MVFHEWMIPPLGFGMYKPDYFSLVFDIVLSPDPMLEPPYDPVKDGVELEIGYDIWVCACMLDAAFNNADDSADCIGYEKEYCALREILRRMLNKKSLFRRQPVYDTSKLCQKAASALQYITGQICASEIAEEYSPQQQKFIASIELLRMRLLSVTSDNAAE